MPKFALILRYTGFSPDLSPEEIQGILDRYRTWMHNNPRLGGEKLQERGGRVMRRSAVTDGPYAESKEIIGGFSIVEARDYDDVVRMCRDHPHLEFGSIEVREVDPVMK